MATSTADAPCPFCGEVIPRGSTRCFRCETDLNAWWVFEDAVASAAPSDVAHPPTRRRAGWRAVLAVLSLAALAGMSGYALGRRPAGPAASSAPVALTPPGEPAPAVPAGSAATQIRLRIVVQKGDSLWSLAARLTGRGDTWQTLWPGLSGSGARALRPGTILEVELPVAKEAPRQ